ncbi:hypothetical protein BD413DRAFT_617691 [Trametes elegans]|nr:hypothetical protein BD413DRAFT_617691 [Trametes elegans]
MAGNPSNGTVPSGSAQSPGPGAPPSLDDTAGAFLLGTSGSLMHVHRHSPSLVVLTDGLPFASLYGIALHQCYRYYRLYPTDTRYIRFLVTAVMLLETAQIPMIIHTCYYSLVSNYGNPNALSKSPWSLKILPVFSGLIVFLAQIFFARRVALLGFAYKILVGVALVFFSLHMGLTIALTVVTIEVHSPQNFGPSNEWIFIVATFAATIADWLLAAGIISGLYRSRELHTSNDSYCDLFVLYVINTGLLTGTFNFIPAVLSAVKPKALIWVALNLIATRLYANTLFSVLNSRKRLSGQGVELFGGETHRLNVFARANHLAAVEQWNAPQIPDKAPTKISINVTAETEADAPGVKAMHKFNADDLAGAPKGRGVAANWTV